MRKLNVLEKLTDARGRALPSEQKVARDGDGKPIVDQSGRAVMNDGDPLTLADVLILSLEQPAKNDDQLSIKKRVVLRKLALRVAEAEKEKLGILEISDEDAVLLKDRVGAVLLNNAVVGAAAMLIEPEGDKANADADNRAE